MVAVHFSACSTYLCCDVNCDGVINFEDLINIAHYVYCNGSTLSAAPMKDGGFY